MASPLASWAPPIGDERLRPRAPTTPLSTLLAQRDLVAPAGALPTHPRGAGVSTPQALPSNLPFGSMPPGQSHSSGFTGATVQHPMSLTQPQDTMFRGPSYPSMPQGGGFGSNPSSVGGFSGGRSALAAVLGSGGGASAPAPVSGDGALHPALTPQVKSQVAAQSGYLSPSTPLGGGYTAPAPTYQGGGYSAPAPSPTSTTFQGGGFTPTLSSTLATAAQRGTKLRLPV